MVDKIVDASALAAVIFGEPEADMIEARIRGCRLTAPTLLPYELSSVCLKKIRAHPTEREAILQRFACFCELPIALRPVDPLAMVEAARALRLTAYDASYLLLAEKSDTELVTLDRDLAAAWDALAGGIGE